MKIKHLFFAVVAVLGFAACQQEEDLGVARIELNPTSLSFGSAVSNQSVTLTATRDWTAQDVPDWVALDPSSGKASTKPQTVNVTVMANSGYNREAEVTLTIGLSKQYLHVAQTGDKGALDTGNGTLERPYTASAAFDYVSSLPADVENGPVYIRGIISTVSMTYGASGTYGNATFYISDDGSAAGTQFYVFQTYYLGNKKWTSGKTDIKVGDEVIICGKVVNYRGNTPETVGKGSSYVYSLNGETDGGGDIDYSKSEPKTVAEFISLANGGTYYKLTGKVSNFNASFCSFDLTDDSGSIYVYSVDNKDEWTSKIKNGGIVVLAGQYEFYASKSQHEVVNAQILSFEEPSAPPAGEPKGTGTLEDPYNPAGANAYIKTLPADKDSDNDIYIKGKISEIKEQFSAQYGNATFNLTESGSKDEEAFSVFRTLYLGNKQWVEGNDLVKVGEEMIICGKVVYYKGNTPETAANKNYIYSWNGKTVDPVTPPGPVNPTDLATIVKAADNTSVAAENVFVGTVSTKGYVATDGKNSLYVYTDSAPTVKKGDIVKFSGTKTTYYDLPEITSPQTEKTGAGEVPYPEPVDITANFDTYKATEAVYVKYTATMYKSGNYTNFKVEGANEMNGSFSNAPTAYYSGINEGDKVVIYGFYNGINASNKLQNVFVVKIDNLTTGKTITGEESGGGGDVTGNTVTFDFTAQGYTNAQEFTGLEAGGVSMTVSKGTNSNGPKYYTTGNAIRFYGDNSFTLASSGKAITKVDLTFSSGEGTNEITVSTGTWVSPTWTGSAASVTFTVGGSTGHRRISKIVVTLAE